MFTGLIEETGTVRKIDKTGGGSNILIDAALVVEGMKIGDSVSIDGACQTVISFGGGSFTVFASKITNSITTLGGFSAGRKVNLERPLTLSSRLGGHIVQGHVDGKGRAARIERDAEGAQIRISAGRDIMKYIVERGSIAVNGVSLTVVQAGMDSFLLYIIPETLRSTTLGRIAPGDEVNIEVDVLAKYVEKITGAGSGGADERLKDKLSEEGFI
jgi:riboflavin synthase